MENTVVSAIETYVPSSSLQLSTALLGIESALVRAAEANVALAGEGFTDAEKEAMTTIEELKLINGMDLAAVLLRGKLLRRIEERSMWSYHPARYGTLQEMAQDQGISVSNLSNIRDLNFVIFPWMSEHGFSVPEKWEQIGMSNFRELIPVLKAIITGEQSNSASVRQSVENILNDTAATLQAATVDAQEVTEDEIRDAAIEELLTAGELMRNRELRARIRPERTPSVNMDSFLERDGTRLIIAEVSEDQWTMIQHRLGAHIDTITIDIPDNPRVRQSSILTRPLVRKLNSLISG
ncbi:MAG: hypothetical protein AAGU17_10740 [Anaerolineaceae bacterium]